MSLQTPKRGMKRNSKWKANRRARMPRTHHHPSEMFDATPAFGEGPPFLSLGVPSILTDEERARGVDAFIREMKKLDGGKTSWLARVRNSIFMAVLKVKMLLWRKKKR